MKNPSIICYVVSGCMGGAMVSVEKSLFQSFSWLYSPSWLEGKLLLVLAVLLIYFAIFRWGTTHSLALLYIIYGTLYFHIFWIIPGSIGLFGLMSDSHRYKLKNAQE